jgi:hypothetical protein
MQRLVVTKGEDYQLIYEANIDYFQLLFSIYIWVVFLITSIYVIFIYFWYWKSCLFMNKPLDQNNWLYIIWPILKIEYRKVSTVFYNECLLISSKKDKH